MALLDRVVLVERVARDYRGPVEHELPLLFAYLLKDVGGDATVRIGWYSFTHTRSVAGGLVYTPFIGNRNEEYGVFTRLF